MLAIPKPKKAKPRTDAEQKPGQNNGRKSRRLWGFSKYLLLAFIPAPGWLILAGVFVVLDLCRMALDSASGVEDAYTGGEWKRAGIFAAFIILFFSLCYYFTT